MSLLPGLTYSAPGAPLYAPVSGGGGSVPANLGVSTLTFGGSSNPALFLNNKGIALNNSTSQVLIGTAGIAWNNTTSNIQILAPSTTSVVVGTNSNVSVLRVSDAGVFASPFMSTPNLQVSSVNGSAYPPAGGVMSTIANAGSYIDIPSGATPMNFNLLNGASLTTPGNAGGITLNGSIVNNATSAASFATGVFQGVKSPIFNIVGGNGVNCGRQVVNNGVPQNVANTSVTAGAIIHLTPVGASVTVPLSYTINAGIGFTLYNNNAAPVDIAWSIHSYDTAAT